MLTLDDMREFSVKVEPAVSGQFRDYTVYTAAPGVRVPSSPRRCRPCRTTICRPSATTPQTTFTCWPEL